MGGENAYRQTVPGLGLGSPPRRRGKEASIFDDGQRLGITPALAGKSREIPLHLRAAKDHPRVGGEKFPTSAPSVSGRRSPPRGRGKVRRRGAAVRRTWITPAWAGKRRISTMTACITRDHPRVGGEKLSSGAYVAKDKGSPPRRRGKGVNVNCSADDIGITPAQAGKSCSDCRCSNRRWDHPRMGGEKHLSGTTDNRPQGSPPRGRGKGYTGQALDSGVRITPAQAGKSPGSASGWPRRRDHPRAGGEKLMGRPRRSVGAGSPPRRRGKDSSGEPANGSIRITPAQAGKR